MAQNFLKKFRTTIKSAVFHRILKKTSCRRAAAAICPAPLLPPWAPKHLAPPSRRQPSSSFSRPTRFHAHRCSRLTRQHGGEQSGLVTLTFDLLTLKVVSQSPVTWATSVPLLVFLGLFVLDLCPIFATDRRQTSDSRQTASSLSASAYRERGIVKHRAFS